MTETPVAKNPRRGAYVVPTFLTVLNVFFGFIAILLSVRGAQAQALGNVAFAATLFQKACWALVVAAVFDTFDGLVARLMKATSEFGKEYDSLADVVTFGAAPAILVYCWALHTLKGLGGGIAFLFLVGGSLRLARFNIMAAKTDHRYFVGLPIPAGALTLAAIINYAPHPVEDRRFAIVMLLVTIGLAFAMVSTVKYRSQKANFQKRLSFPAILLIVLIIAVFLRWPEEVWFVTAIAYVSTGPLVKLWTVAFQPSGGNLPPADPKPVVIESPLSEESP